MDNRTSPDSHGENRDPSTDLQIFANGEFNLEIIPIGDSFIVNAPGLARALGSRDATNLLANVPADEKGYFLDSTPGSDQVVWHVKEPGFYRLIGQRQIGRIKNLDTKGQVERFQRWVFHDVIPSIRRTGSYSADQLPQPRRELSNRELAAMVIEEADRADRERELRLAAVAQVEAMAPIVREVEQHRAKSEYVDVFIDGRQDVTSFRVYCTQIEAPERKFREHLVAKGVIYKKPIGRRFSRSKGVWVTDDEYHPRADYKKWFHLKDQPEAPRHHNGQMRTTLYVTPLGKVKILEWLKRHPLGGAA